MRTMLSMRIRPTAKHRTQALQGFTLVELLVTMAVLVVAVSIAAPAFNDMVLRHRAASTTNEFLASLSEARSEAARRRRNVTVCARASGGDTAECNADNQATGACQCSGTAWENGWLTFVDMNADGTLGTVADTGDTLIYAHPPLANNTSLRRSGASPANETLAFNAQGNLVGTAATFALCLADDTADPSDDQKVLKRARFVDVALSGRSGVRGVKATETATQAACRFGAAS